MIDIPHFQHHDRSELIHNGGQFPLPPQGKTADPAIREDRGKEEVEESIQLAKTHVVVDGEAGTDDRDVEDESGFRTPTSAEYRIPPATKCPPAPIKKRKSCDVGNRRCLSMKRKYCSSLAGDVVSSEEDDGTTVRVVVVSADDALYDFDRLAMKRRRC